MSLEMPNNDWPDWCDAGKMVEINVDGILTQGKLEIDDFGIMDGDEYPIFTVLDDNGIEHSFASQDDWHYL